MRCLALMKAIEQSAHITISAGDLGDLVPALEPKRRVQWEMLTAGELEGMLASAGHCSALVKVTGNYSDLFLSHSSWFTYRWAVYFKHGGKLYNLTAQLSQPSFL